MGPFGKVKYKQQIKSVLWILTRVFLGNLSDLKKNKKVVPGVETIIL